MSSEISRDQDTVATAGNAAHGADRRKQHHPVEVKVFGGTRAAERRMGVGAGVVWFASIVLVAMGWWVYIKAAEHQLDYKPGAGFGYYLGLVGGVMMLLMLLYPVRKHLQFTRGWGPLRYWFMLHMIFGIGGPVLILFHSTFHVRSLNAGVAMYSMLLVVASGIIGRFIYKRIHHGLYGRKSNLDELQQAVDVNQSKISKVNAVLMEATGIGEKLKKFRIMAIDKKQALPVRAWRFIALGWQRHNLAAHCRRELRLAVAHLARSQGWDSREQQQHYQEVVQDAEEYLRAVQQAAQFSSYERLFRLWHVLHSPFVWLLGVSGIVHVIATNFMY
ncbi:MAG: hypothetical protein WCB93_01320 [Gallionella sp.]